MKYLLYYPLKPFFYIFIYWSTLVCAVPSGLCKSELLWSRSRFQEFSLALGLWRETSSCDALIFYLLYWGWMRVELTQLHVSWSQLFPPKHILYPVTHTHGPSPLAWSPAPLGLIVCSFFFLSFSPPVISRAARGGWHSAECRRLFTPLHF